MEQCSETDDIYFRTPLHVGRWRSDQCMCTPPKAKPIKQHPLVCCRHFFLNSRSKTKPPESEVKCLCTSHGYFHIYKRCLCVSHTSISIRHRTQTSTWWKMEQSLSLTTYQLTTHINLTLWAYDPIYLLQMLTTLLTSLRPPFLLPSSCSCC